MRTIYMVVLLLTSLTTSQLLYANDWYVNNNYTWTQEPYRPTSQDITQGCVQDYKMVPVDQLSNWLSQGYILTTGSGYGFQTIVKLKPGCTL